MKPFLSNILRDPVHLESMTVESSDSISDEIISGNLVASDGTKYPIQNGVPRFVLTEDKGQLQTKDTFDYKWKKRDTYDSTAAKSVAAQWLIEKYGFKSQAEWVDYYASRQNVLDVGCGSGFSSSLWLDSPYWVGEVPWIGVDISGAIDTALERLSQIRNTYFVQADALQLPFADNSVDAIFSEGVLHHTPSTSQALFSCSRVLAHGGEINFYVYRKKGPVREFTDDYIRDQIAGFSDEEAWNAMRSLTRLGQILSEANTSVELDIDIPLLGVTAGQYTVQRLIYWNFAKVFWNPEFSFEENVHVNFDWYRPKYAHRQTAEELRAWCAQVNLKIIWFHEQESGFTVRAIKE